MDGVDAVAVNVGTGVNVGGNCVGVNEGIGVAVGGSVSVGKGNVGNGVAVGASRSVVEQARTNKTKMEISR